MNTFPYISNKRLFGLLALAIVAWIGVSILASKAYGETPQVFKWFGVKPGSVQVGLIAKLGYCEVYRIQEDGKATVYAAVSSMSGTACAVTTH